MVKLLIREQAKAHGLTLADLASRLGIKPASLSQALARNSFSTEKLEEIANAIGCDVVDLFASDKNNAHFVCPHCGKPISVRIE